MSKFTCANQKFGAVTIQHLDELIDANKQVYFDLLERCRGLHGPTTTTVFIFMSQHFLIHHLKARKVFINCSHCTTLRVIALDEVHIQVQHGTSFRSKMGSAGLVFFQVISWTIADCVTAAYRTNGNNAHILPPTFVQIAHCQLIPGRVYFKRIPERLRPVRDQVVDINLLNEGSVCFQGIDSCLGILTRYYWEECSYILQLLSSISAFLGSFGT